MKRLGRLMLFSSVAAMTMLSRTVLAAEEAPAVQMSTVDKCRQDLMSDAFPAEIVEKALTSKGIAQSQIKEIMGKLSEGAKNIPEMYATEYQSNVQEEPAATNDPLSEIYMTENLNDVREEVFLNVMKEYVSDAQLAVSMFNDITTQRNAAIKDCGKMK